MDSRKQALNILVKGLSMVTKFTYSLKLLSLLAVLLFTAFGFSNAKAATCTYTFPNNFNAQVTFAWVMSQAGCSAGDDIILNNVNDKNGLSSVTFDADIALRSLTINYKSGNNPLEFIIPSGVTVDITNNLDFNVSSTPQEKFLDVDGTLNVGGTLDLGGINFEIDGTGTIAANEITGADNTTCSTGSGGTSTCPTINVTTGCDDGTTDGSGFCGGGDVTVLPIELKYLKAKTTLGGVQVNWASITESNFSHYLVERSTDGTKTFKEVAKVKAEASESTAEKEYSWIDTQPYYGANYYRLRAVDLDGSEEIHGLTVAYVGTDGAFKVSPNPANVGKSNVIKITYPGAALGTTLKIINGQGVEVMQIPLTEINTILPISSFSPGVYILQTQNGLETKSTRLIVQK